MADAYTTGSDLKPPSEANTSPAKHLKADFWYSVFECMEGNPKIDFEKLAEKCNYKNAVTARVIYNQKRRLISQSNGVEASPTTNGAKRGRKPKDSSADIDGETVKKRGRKPKTTDTATDKPAKKRGRPAKKVTSTPLPEVGSGAQDFEAQDFGVEEEETDVYSD